MNEFSGLLLDCRYHIVQRENGEQLPEIIIYFRDSLGGCKSYKITNYHPYFYVECDQENLNRLLKHYPILEDWILYFTHTSRKEYNKGKSTDLLKLTGRRPWETPTIRKIFHENSIQTHEADIPYVHRFLIDNQLYGLRYISFNNGKVSPTENQELYDFKIMSFDLEIDIEFSSDKPSDSLSNIMETGSKRITMISCAFGTNSGNCQTQVFTLHNDSNEKEGELITKFWEFVWTEISPDVIVNYNGDNFDIPYMLKRMELLQISPTIMSPQGDSEPIQPGYGRGFTIPGVLLYDLFKKTKWIYTEDGRKSLGSIAKVILGKDKNEIPKSHGEMWREGLNDPELLMELENYAEVDAEITFQLFFGLGMSEWIDVIRITGSPPREAMYYTQRQAGEFLLYRVMYKEGILIPPTPGSQGKKERDKERKSAEGGFVFEPKKSIASGVMIADFSSMYPTLMISHNIGAEAFLGIKHPFKKRFRAKPKTSMALMQEMLLNERLSVKRELSDSSLDENNIKRLERYSWALKIVMNSTIGSYNYTGSRLYNTSISGSVTGLGRTYLQELAVMAKSYNQDCETIYGDTDSVFIELPKTSQIDKIWDNTTDEIDLLNDLPELRNLLEHLRKHLPDQMRLDLQDVAYRILFHKGAKKRYSYISLISKQIKIVGFEAVRHDWSPFAREVQKKAIEVVLLTGDLQESKSQMIEYLSKKIKTPVEALKQEFITLGPIKRSPTKYKSITPAMAAFAHFCEITNQDVEKEWKNYDYFPFLILKGDYPLYQRSKHPNYVKNQEIDVNYYFQEALNAINRFNLNIMIHEILFEKYDMEDFFLSYKTN